LGEDVEGYLSHRPVEARPDGALYRASRFIRRHAVASAAVALATIAVIGGDPVLINLKFNIVLNQAIAERTLGQMPLLIERPSWLTTSCNATISKLIPSSTRPIRSILTRPSIPPLVNVVGGAS
jgi:hypothetical protein